MTSSKLAIHLNAHRCLTTLILFAVTASLFPGLANAEHVVWHPLTIAIAGPDSPEKFGELDDQPNPFLDFRVQVRFDGPSGQTYDVPGYFDGDGAGGDVGNVWQAKFTPDEAGEWTYVVSFRQGPGVAVSLDANAGAAPTSDGQGGTLNVAQRDPQSPGFLKYGRLEYVGGHYLKFRDGPYWIRGGADSPENFLAYAGFDNTPPQASLPRSRGRLAQRGSRLERWQGQIDHRCGQLAGRPESEQPVLPHDEYRRRRRRRLALGGSSET